MLEGLPAVDWEHLNLAYGPATAIPDLLRALASKDPEDWVAALDTLHETLYDTSDATPAAVPFLIELLTYPEVRCRGRILEFLGATAAAPAEGAEPLAIEQKRARRSREAIWNGLDVYLHLLTDPDQRLRISVPYTLGLLVQHASAEMPEAIRDRDPYGLMVERMTQRLAEEPSALVRASLLFGLGCLASHSADAKSALERQVEDNAASSILRVSAAMGLAGSSAPLAPAALEVLLAALQTPDETNRLYQAETRMEEKHHPLAKWHRGLEPGAGHDPQDVGKAEDVKFPWRDTRPTMMIVNRLARPDADYLDRVVAAVTPYLDRATYPECNIVCEPIVRLVLGDRKITPDTTRADLTPAQYEVLRHLHDNPLMWETATPFWEFGLPDERAAWARLLGIAEKPLTDADIQAILARVGPAQRYSWEGPQIRRLNLRQIGTPAFLKHLGQFPDLEDLDMTFIPLHDDDMPHLLQCPKLKSLQIPDAKIGDAGVQVLAQLRELANVNVSGGHFTDAGLSALQSLENLRQLILGGGPRVSAEAVRRFRAARPKCEVMQ